MRRRTCLVGCGLLLVVSLVAAAGLTTIGLRAIERRAAAAAQRVHAAEAAKASATANASAPEPGTPANAASPTAALAPDRRLTFAYYFYWYDAQTGAHLDPHILANHFPPPPAPQPSWRDPAWEQAQLSDMVAAGIDVALPVYWGFDRPQDQWSPQGLSVLAQARQALVTAGRPAPAIGMFFDTTIVDRRDLTTAAGMAWFYANFHDFFTRIPRASWALVDGRPVVFLFTSDFTQAVNQATFDYVYSHFEADFGVRPYIVREISWDYPILGWNGSQRIRDYAHPIRTENRYLWAAAIHGFVKAGGVAAVGPGFDDHLVPGRNPVLTPRRGGDFYRQAWTAAIASGMPLVAVETWNEMHEASDVCASLEYGRTYIDLTRSFADRFHAGH